MVHRNGIAKNETSHMFKSRLTRPFYYQRTNDKVNFIGLEVIPYDLMYTVTTLSLTMEENAQLTEQMIWYLSRKPSVRMIYSSPHTQIEMPGYIYEYSIVDEMSYDTLQNETLRLFRMTYDLTLSAYLFYEKQNVHSVSQIRNNLIFPDYNGELNPHLDDRFSVINKPTKEMLDFEEP